MDNTFDSLYYSKGSLIGGLDESGVSDIAGPLVAACVVLPQLSPDSEDLRVFNINDSKKIPEKYRKNHAEVIYSVAVGIGIGEAQPIEIDYLGKRKATILAMIRAVSACQTKTHKTLVPDYLIVDGEISLPLQIDQACIKDGDTKSLSIAAASIIAKVYRDNIMLKFHQDFPQYNWHKNKGYPCEDQFKGLDSHGIQVGIHRTKFWPFVVNDKQKDGENRWYYRRGVWRQKTYEALVRESGGAPWITNEQSSKDLKSSNRGQDGTIPNSLTATSS